MSSKLTVCGVCEYRNIKTSSVVWCSECEEGLCQKCTNHHAASKGTRNHSIVPISKYQKLPSNVLKLTKICPKHNERYQIYCKKHDIPCCRRCVVETHDTCGELNAIDDVIRNVKSSSAFLEMEQMLAELSENFQRIRKGRQNNIGSLKENKIRIEKEIEQTRILINSHMDKLQEKLIKELYVAEEKENKKISCLISSLQEKEREITEYQTNLNKIKQHASDLQAFLALKHIQQNITNNEQFLESLLKENSMKHIILSHETENTLKYLPTAMNKMGSIILFTSSSDITLTKRKNKQAQITVPTTHVPTIYDSKLTLIQTVNTQGTDITDCTLLHDGKMIFSSHCKLNVVNTDGSLDFTLDPSLYISHIHFIEDSQKLVLTSNGAREIMIIDWKKIKKPPKSIDVDSQIFGISHTEGKLFYNGGPNGLCIVRIDDESITQLVNVSFSRYSGIAIWSDKLYYINNDDSVTCCDLQGTFQWKSEVTAFLQSARGITVDNHGRVYVSGFCSNNVVVFSPDGNYHRVMLSEKDGIKQPQALSFDRRNNKLLISNHENEAFFYDVSN